MKKVTRKAQHYNYMTINTWCPEVQMHGPVWYVANCSSLWITNWVKFGSKIILFLNVLSILHYELNMRQYKASKKRLWLFGRQVHQSPSELFADSQHIRLLPLSGQLVHHSSLQTTDWNDHSIKHTVYNSEQVYESRLESVTNGNQHALCQWIYTVLLKTCNRYNL